MDDLDVLAGLEPAVDAAVEAELAAYITDGVAPQEPWRITSVRQADWAIQRLAEIDARARQYEDEVALWRAAVARISSGRAWLEARLREWAIDQRTDKVKTFPLAHGTVATREQKARVVVDDEDAAVAWAERAQPSAVRVTKKLALSEVDVRVVDVPVAWKVVDTATGEVSEVVRPDDWPDSIHDGVVVDEGHQVVDVETAPMVVDADGRRVPGLGVAPGKITASVTPLGA